MPTPEEKIATYEQFLHKLHMLAEVAMDSKKVGKLIGNACCWSYAHRMGNGQFSPDEQQELVDRAFAKLLDVD